MILQYPRSHLFSLYLVLNLGIVIIVILWATSLNTSPLTDIPSAENSPLSRLGNWNLISSIAGNQIRTRDCGPCGVSPELCAEYGAPGLARAMSYMGSGESFKRFIIRAREGKGFTMAVIGGSVSEGRGLPLDGATHTKYTPRNLHRVIYDHLNKLFPATNGSLTRGNGKSEGKNGFVNGAVAGTGSEYFSMCSQLHVPDDADLVITELAINDELELGNINSFELMLRSVLELPNQPAVIDLQILALVFPTIVLGGDLHLGVLQHYDIPTVSVRNVLLPQIMGNNTLLRKWFLRNSSDKPLNYGEVDMRHLSQLGHQLSGDLVNTYIDMQVCELQNWEAANGPATVDTFKPLPLSRGLISKPFDLWGKTPKLEKVCASTASKEYPLEIVSAEGWAPGTRKGKKYILSNVPGSTVTFKTRTTYGQIQISALRSQVQGLGNALCWVDNDKDKAKTLQGFRYSKYSVTRSFVIGTGLKPGDHTVSCEVLDETKDPRGAKEFRIAAVMSI